MSMVIIWILASLVAAPTVWARQWNENPVWTAAQQTAPMMELDVNKPVRITLTNGLSLGKLFANLRCYQSVITT